MKIGAYIKETANELIYKVSWPTWQDLQNSGVVVMVASLIIGIIVFFMDKTFSTILNFYYQMFE